MTTPKIKSFSCSDGRDGDSDLHVTISVADSIIATSVLAHLINHCAQYRAVGQEEVTLQSETNPPVPEPVSEPVPEDAATEPVSEAAAPRQTKPVKVKKKAPPKIGKSVEEPVAKPADKPTEAAPAMTVVKELSVVPAADAKEGDAAGDDAVPEEVKAMTSFRKILIWMANNVSRDPAEIAKRVQQYRPHVPAIQRIDSSDEDVLDRITRGIDLLVTSGVLEAA